jgi:hydrogenase maturation factor
MKSNATIFSKALLLKLQVRKFHRNFDEISDKCEGGLLVCLPPDKAEGFCKELEELDGHPAWIIGKVLESSADRSENSSTILSNPSFIFV